MARGRGWRWLKGKTEDGRLFMEMVDAEREEGRKYDEEVAERERR
jgi:hypothetical protein